MFSNILLRGRSLFCICVLFILVILIPFMYYRGIMNAKIEDERKAQATHELLLVHWLTEQKRGFAGAEQLQPWLKEVADKLNLRVSYIADNGKVVADSHIPLSDIAAQENMVGRPEIAMARSQEFGIVSRFSPTHKQEMIFVAKSIGAQGGVPAGFLRLAVPVPKAQKRVETFSESVLAILAAVLITGFLVIYRITHHQDKSLHLFVDAAEAVRGGNYGYRVRVTPGREFSPLVHSFNAMAESIEAHIHTITDQKQQLEAILNGMREGVLVLDFRGRIQTANRAMERIIPFVSTKAGRTPMEVIMNPELQAACDRVLSGSTTFEAQPYNLQITLDRDRIYDINVVRMRDAQNRIGAILVFYDVGEIKRLEKVRQDFVANVSHELRTPLTSIKGYAETLLADDQQESSAMRPFLEVILKNANHMTKIVEDLLQLARLDSGQQAMRLAPIDALPVALDAWDACSPTAESRNIHLQNLLPEKGIQVEADADQLVQVFINLMENAVKYSPEGGSVTVSSASKGNWVTFAVNDEGPGIPKADQQRIFERFYRVERHRSIQPGSSGLGLAICRHIILNHGGRIWVESPPSRKIKGSTFYFTLPAGHAQGG